RTRASPPRCSACSPPKGSTFRRSARAKSRSRASSRPATPSSPCALSTRGSVSSARERGRRGGAGQGPAPKRIVLLARVAVPAPLVRAFTFVVPPELAPSLRRGARVLCEFGLRRLLAVVLDVGERASDVPPDKLKRVQ